MARHLSHCISSLPNVRAHGGEVLSADAAARHPNQISILIYVEVLPYELFAKVLTQRATAQRKEKSMFVPTFV